MSILATEIKLFRSTNGLGGAITATEVVSNSLHNLFDIVTSVESRDGDTEYRCFYVKNTNTSFTLNNASIQLVSDTPSEGTAMGLGLDSAVVGTSAQVVADEGTPPIGVTFNTTEGVELAIGNIPSGSFKAVWIRRAVLAGTSAAASDAATLRVIGETTA